ncbi:MAG: anti-sigma factor [Actinomycetota bacterium]|nr:anti-sigma factor [Actinomycetota bacterium]
MIEDHDRIEELLAGHAMHSLDGEDAREVDRLLTEHVPGCARCRETLAVFQEVLGELALATSPVEPPELLLARLRSELRQEPIRELAGRRRSFGVWAAAAAAVAVVGLVAWNSVLDQRLGHVQSQQKKVTNVLSFMNQPGSRVVDLTDARLTSSRVLMGYRPRETRVFLLGTDVPDPDPGKEYRLWLGQGGQFTFIGAFTPDDGIVVLPLSFDASRYDQILITEESTDSEKSAPRGSRRWSAELTPAA